MVETAKAAAGNPSFNTTAFLANVSSVAAVQQGSMSSVIRRISDSAGAAMATGNSNWAVPADVTGALNALQTVSEMLDMQEAVSTQS